MNNKRSDRELIDNPSSDDEEISSKRFKSDNALQIYDYGEKNTALIISNYAENSGRIAAPEVTLSGHEGAIYSIDFSPSGEFLCSGSYDKKIFLWDIFGNFENYNVLEGHKNAVLEVKWPTDDTIVSCSADKTVAIWNANSGERIRKFVSHTGIVNSCDVAIDNTNYIVSGSDDCKLILWDARTKSPSSIIHQDYQICSVCISNEGNYVYSGGIDNIIRRYDCRMLDSKFEPDMELKGHSDTITGLSLSPDGNHLLSNSMDSNLRCWDVRPFVTSKSEHGVEQRCESVIEGVHHGAEKLLLKCNWSPDQEFFTSGSADRTVHVWESTNFNHLYAWSGHKASVNQVIFHPTEPYIASCSSDRQIIIGEFINS